VDGGEDGVQVGRVEEVAGTGQWQCHGSLLLWRWGACHRDPAGGRGGVVHSVLASHFSSSAAFTLTITEHLAILRGKLRSSSVRERLEMEGEGYKGRKKVTVG